MVSVGQRLKKIRTELRLSQEAFAEKMLMTRASIAAVEADKNNFSQEALCKLLLTFNVNINYLLGGVGLPFLKSDAAEFEDVKADILKEVREMLKDEGIIK